MTLIMNNLAMSISILAMVISLSMAYLKYKTEMIDREERLKRMEKRRVEMTESYFDYHKWDK